MPLTAPGEILGKRLPLLSLTLARVFIACTILLQSRHYAIQDMPLFITRSFVFGWAVLALVGLFISLPRTGGAFLAVLLFDLLFAACIILLGAPVTAVLLLLFSEIVLSAGGWRWASVIVLLPFSILVATIWLVESQFDLKWIELQLLPSDIVVWGIILAGYAATVQIFGQRRANLARLSGDIWIDPILASNQPFSYDFAKWVEEIGKLFRSSRSISLLALTQKAGSIRIFSNVDVEPYRAELTKGLATAASRLPARLSVIRDRDRVDQMALDATARPFPLFPLLDQSVIMARHFKLGRQSGMLIIAHDQPNDAILEQEAKVVNQAMDDVLERIDKTMEVRRAFLAEAREVARRDLHDGVLQSLAALRMRLLTIIQTHEVESAINAEIRSTAEIIALEQARLRSLLDENVDADQPVNLVEALRLCVRTTALQWEIEIDFASTEMAVPMHRESASNVEYLVREVIANATRHSRSSNLRCSLALRDDNLIISMMDLSGTPTALHGHSDPLSSQSLRQRLALVNGRAYSEGLQSGTLLAVAIPMIYDEADL